MQNPFDNTKKVEKITMSLGELINMYNELNFDVYVSFGNVQRKESWRTNPNNIFFHDKKVINSIFDHVDIGLITLQECKDFSYNVIDGKHRIKAIKSFVDNEFSVNRNGIEFFWKDMSMQFQLFFKRTSIQACFTRKDITDLEICEYFVAKNDYGVPQDNEHIQTVKTWIEKYKQA